MKLRAYAGLGALLLLAAAAWPADGTWDYSEIQNVPEKQKVKTNPMEKDPEAAMAGKILFEDHCEECHGENGEGKKKAPSLRAKEVQEATPGSDFLGPDERGSAEEDAGMVEVAGAAALAIGELH